MILPRQRLLIATITVLGSLGAASLFADEVVLRGGAVRQGTVIDIADGGVSLEVITGAVEVLSWDRVRRVDGPRDVDAAKYAAIADTAWRARYRLERGDPFMAGPLFETLYERYRGEVSPTALVVSEGVLRCRLQAGATKTKILEPYLQLLRLRRAGVKATAFLDLEPILDEETELLFSLPPLLVFAGADAGLDRTHLALGEDPVVRAIAELYDCALVRASEPARPTPSLPVEHPGAELLHLLLSAQSASEAVRSDAQQRLRELQVGDGQAWLRAWQRVGLGLSLCLQGDTESRLEGVLELMHVPLLFGETMPELARAAAGAAAEQLASLGRLDQADQVRLDFGAPAGVETLRRKE